MLFSEEASDIVWQPTALHCGDVTWHYSVATLHGNSLAMLFGDTLRRRCMALHCGHVTWRYVVVTLYGVTLWRLYMALHCGVVMRRYIVVTLRGVTFGRRYMAIHHQRHVAVHCGDVTWR